MKNITKTVIKAAIELIFPKVCPLCEKLKNVGEQEGVCSKCRKKIIYISEPFCNKCGKEIDDNEKELCYDCSKNKHYFDKSRALYSYNDDIKKSIYSFKYKNQKEFAKFYAKDIHKKFSNWIVNNRIDIIVPIPLHKKKLKKRGYNQAELLARELSKFTDAQVVNVVERIKYTKPQKALSNIKRKENLKDAFIIKEGIEGLNILLIDDIYTTGSTLDNVSKILYKNKANKVVCLCLCIGEGV